MKKPRAPKLVTVAITTTITVVFWVFFTLYQVLTRVSPSSVDPILLEPISPSLDTTLLNSIPERVFFEEGEVIAPIPAKSGPGLTSLPEEINEEVIIEGTPPPATSEAELEE